MSDQIGIILKKNRQQHNLSLSTVSEQTGISVSTLSRIERNLVRPDHITMVALAKWLGISLEDTRQRSQYVLDRYADIPTPEVLSMLLSNDKQLSEKGARVLDALFQILYDHFQKESL